MATLYRTSHPLVAAFANWMTNTRRLRGATVISYLSTLNQLVPWLDEAGLALETVSAADLEKFMNRVRVNGKVGTAATADRDRHAMMAFWKWANGRGHLPMNPTIDIGVPKVSNRAPRAVPDAVWEALWASPMPDEDRAWLGLLGFAGLRRRELVSLRPESIDWRRGLLLGLKRKGGNEDAVEYESMARLIADGLPRLLPDPDGWLEIVKHTAESRMGEKVFVTFDEPMSARDAFHNSFNPEDGVPLPRKVSKNLNRLLRNTTIPRSEWFTPHALRHTTVTNLLRLGVPIEVVSDAVGHSNIDTTRRYVKSAGRLDEWRKRLG